MLVGLKLNYVIAKVTTPESPVKKADSAAPPSVSLAAIFKIYPFDATFPDSDPRLPMPSILSDADRETVKRTVPKSSNKIQAVAVVKLYVAYPNKQRWTYTGLQGAAVLTNDLVGNTFWIKLVDVSPARKGVIWDQEIYEPFYYNQDRTFFHTFELEDCLAGLSFADEKEAKKFKSKMDDREKNADKATKKTPFSGTAGSGIAASAQPEKHHSRLSNLLHGHRPSSTASVPTTSIIPPRQPPLPVQAPPPAAPNGHISELDAVDPSWRGMLQELMKMGITEDQIAENAEFIKSYIQQQQQSNGTSDPANGGRAKPPPPPPVAPPGGHRPISPQNTGSTTASRRGPPPAPPTSRRSRMEVPSAPSPPPQNTPPRTPSPPRPKFHVPPPLADAGKFAGSNAPAPPSRKRIASASTGPSSGPPPPPRPPKTPEIDDDDTKQKWGVPPPFTGERHPNAPPPPARSAVPAPPPRSRDISSTHSIPPLTAVAPPLPPKIPVSSAPVGGPPPPPARKEVPSAVPPPPPRTAQAVPPPPSLPSNNAPPPPPPPFPSSNAPPPPPPPPFPTNNAPPPPPPPPPPTVGGGPPAPPPPPRGPSAVPPPAAKPDGAPEMGNLLASIRGSGGVGGGGLRKVKESEKRDRSAAQVPGTEPAVSPTTATAGGAAAGGLAGSLAAALAIRNKKVSASDDEDDNDEWD